MSIAAKALNNNIQQLVKKDDEESLKEAIRQLESDQKKYQEGKQKKWIISFLATALFGIGAYFLTTVLYEFTKTALDRNLLLNVLSKKFARFKISQPGTNELLLISYAYDERQPRFYCK